MRPQPCHSRGLNPVISYGLHTCHSLRPQPLSFPVVSTPSFPAASTPSFPR
ncbi:hypothetical protein JMY81_23670 [Brenneria goodwinii]|nr:hypothetical protein [Brenneria goodwinii]MCG8163788.1 hypothetical protein [Brenneria goodwinii]MCG8168403.1 hypothetical protein [Brenneria goodwinii]MCG8172657.1 hypothetical protein [Brenneria goodwinii]MCG8177361.1 hypothetical protein [Brenneria goodwinii]